jgi:hypothetical protein
MRKVLVRWDGESAWHFAESINHGTTACNLHIPFKDASPEYAEIEILEIKSFKGTCKNCFHEMCSEIQDQDMWTIYYELIA